LAAIDSPDPVLFLEPKRIYNGPFYGDPTQSAQSWSRHPLGEVPDGHYHVPIGVAKRVREGHEVSIISYGTMVHVAQAAAEAMGVDADIIDVRSIVPLDVATIVDSVNRTGRCVIVHEATRFAGFGAEIAALVQEKCFWNLNAPIERVGGFDTPYPHAFEWEYFPGPKRIQAALTRVLEPK
jgi:2-oxoisovalerate dehydrogenase E1 component beta subunit